MEFLAKISIVAVVLFPFVVRILWNVFERDRFKGLTGPLDKLPR